MSSQLAQLYSSQLLALAADIPHVGSLDAPMGRVRERAPLCGSNLQVDLMIEDGRVTEFAQDVQACALGQAAASVVGAGIIGCTKAQLETAKAQFKAFLTEDGPIPDSPFEAFEALMPARDFANRHASIMLAITASLNAFEMAEGLKE